MEHVEFFKEFPLLLPKTLDPLEADGEIEVAEGFSVNLSINTGKTGVQCTAAIQSSTPGVEQYLVKNQNILDERFKQCTSALSFVREIRHALTTMPTCSAPKTSGYYSKIVEECDTNIGWECVESYDEKSQIMTISVRDDSDRAHQIYANFRNETFSSTVDDKVVSMNAGLSRYIEVIKKTCKEHSEAWAVLDDVDSSLCVLQPRHPKRSDLSRRIAVTELATALFQITPESYYPKVVIYGPKNIAGMLNVKAKSIKDIWSHTRPARENLEKVLEIELPGPQSFDQSDINLDCGICLSYEMENETPDQICVNDICARPFHRRCLVQWLTSKEDTRQSYNTYFGKCPYCSENISVSAV